MTLKRITRRHDEAFLKKAVNLVLEQGYSVPEAADVLGIVKSLPYKWKAKTPRLVQIKRMNWFTLEKKINNLKWSKKF